MKKLRQHTTYIICTLTAVLFSYSFQTKDPSNDVDKKYSIAQLKTDFQSFRDTLQKYHPRLYEFTPKKEFDQTFDSLYANISGEMTGLEFRHFIMPVIAKVHCCHTDLQLSAEINAGFPAISKFPPFKLYYEDNRAFVRYNLSSNTALTPGSEVISINDIPATTLINSFLQRVTLEGIHKTAVYYKMNYPKTTLFFAMPNYYKIENYKIELLSPDKTKKTISVNAISHKEYYDFMADKNYNDKHELKFIDKNTALLKYPLFDYPNDEMRMNYIPNVFKTLKNKKIKNLIIDLRGNFGGPGENSAEFIKYLMKKEFIYYKPDCSGGGYEEYKKLIPLPKNTFTGKIYCLIDGGCLSSTGHFIALIKYHNLGVLIGEESSATFSCNSNGQPFILPNTKLVLFCPNAIYESDVKGFERAKGIPPDYEVKTPLKDLIAGNDVVLKYTLDLINNKK
jgi:hypothetical protein